MATTSLIPKSLQKYLTWQNVLVLAVVVVALIVLVNFLKQQRRTTLSMVGINADEVDEETRLQAEGMAERAGELFDDWSFSWADGLFSSSWDTKEGDWVRDMLQLTPTALRLTNNVYNKNFGPPTLRAEVADLYWSVETDDRDDLLAYMNQEGITT